MREEIRENYRVVVVINHERAYGRSQEKMEKSYHNDCRTIEQDIKRHVDGFYSTEIIWDNADRCNHCESIWTEEGSEYNGGCCIKDRENEPNTEANLI